MGLNVINFPKMFNIKTLTLDTLDSSKDPDYYKVSIMMLLKTTLGTLEGDINYGTVDIVLDINNANTLEMFCMVIADALRNNIPEFKNLTNDDVKLYSNDGAHIVLDIKNKINPEESNLTFNLNDLLK